MPTRAPGPRGRPQRRRHARPQWVGAPTRPSAAQACEIAKAYRSHPIAEVSKCRRRDRGTASLG
eukprot:14355429-Alexandrium_andersonii.AAC.1